MGNFLGFKMSKSRGGEEKLRQKRAERRKKKKLGNMNSPPNLWVFLAIFTINLGKMKFLDKRYPSGGVSPIYIYMCIYIDICKRIYTHTNGSTLRELR